MFKVFVFRCVARRWRNKFTQETKSEGLGMFRYFLFMCVGACWLNNLHKKRSRKDQGCSNYFCIGVWRTAGRRGRCCAAPGAPCGTYLHKKRGRKDQGCSNYRCLGLWRTAGRRGRCCAAPGAPCGSGASPPRLSGIRTQFHISIIGGVYRYFNLPIICRGSTMQLHGGAEHFGNIISELTSKYHIGAQRDIICPRQDFCLTCTML